MQVKVTGSSGGLLSSLPNLPNLSNFSNLSNVAATYAGRLREYG